MRCHDVQNKLVDCLYNEIPADGRAAVMAHVAQCSACRAEWEALEDGRRLISGLPPDEEHPAVDVRRLLHTATQRAQRQRSRWQGVAVACAAAAAVLLITLLAGLRVEVSQQQIVMGWGERPEPVRDGGPPADTVARLAGIIQAVDRMDKRAAGGERQIAELTRQLQAIDELARLATAELLAVDQRHTRELARLRDVQSRREQSLRAELSEIRQQGDLRWKLTVHELSQRPELSAVSVVESAAPAQ